MAMTGSDLFHDRILKMEEIRRLGRLDRQLASAEARVAEAENEYVILWDEAAMEVVRAARAERENEDAHAHIEDGARKLSMAFDGMRDPDFKRRALTLNEVGPLMAMVRSIATDGVKRFQPDPLSDDFNVKPPSKEFTPEQIEQEVAAGKVKHLGWCGVEGQYQPGQHSCSLCGKVLATAELCGHSAAPFTGRACEACQRRVTERRIKIMNLHRRLSQASLTPFNAIEARDAILSELIRTENGPDAAGGIDANVNLALANVTGLDGRPVTSQDLKAAVRAEIVAWDPGLEHAALRGLEAFDGRPWDAKPCLQWLFLEKGTCVLVMNGEHECHAIMMLVGNAREGIHIVCESIRRGELLTFTGDAAWLAARRQDNQYDKAKVSRKRFWIEMAALLAFMELEVVQREARQVPRQARRAAERAGKPLPKVMVVRLRRVYAEQQTGETEVEWRHRWMVRGHWRRQWYGKTREHKLIYIAPFIKGPEGKPFLEPRDVVKVVVR